jgi:UV DNA damage endonuclease
VVEKTIDELNKHAEIMDMMGLDQSNFYPINIHIGTTKPNKLESSKKFCRNFNRLSESCRKRLTVENDDSETQFSIKELYEMVYSDIGIPIVADSLHHYCNPNNTTWENALRLAVSTWNVIPVAHHSSSKKIFEDNKATVRTHADFIYERFENFDIKIDVELECKKKDLALIKYKNDFSL